MWVVAVLASLTVVLLILILLVPVDMVLHIDVHGRPKFHLRYSWLFGLINKEVRGGKKRSVGKGKVVEGKRKVREKTRGIGSVFKILRSRDLVKKIKNLLKDIFSSIKVRDLVVDLRIGLDNPAETGLLFAFIGPAVLFLHPRFPHRIMVEPSFGETVFEGYSYGKVIMQPIRLVVPFLKFFLSLAVIRTIKALVLSRWKRKKK